MGPEQTVTMGPIEVDRANARPENAVDGERLVFLELSTRTDGLTDSLTKDKPVELFPVFKAPGDGVKTVELFMPQMTVAIGLPVVEVSAVDYSVDEVLAKAKLDESDPGPFAMNSIVLSADGSSDTRKK